LLKIKIKVIVKYLDISKSTLYRWSKENEKRNMNPTRVKGKSKLSNIRMEFINYITKNNTYTLNDFSIYLLNNYNIKVSISTIYRFCVNNNITYKKGTISYFEADKEKSKQFLENIKLVNLEKLVVLDEASFVLNHSKSYGRSKKGSRAIIIKPGKRLKRYSLLLSITSTKVFNWILVEGSINSKIFREFISKIHNGNIVVMDNTRIHHSTNVLTSQGLSTIKELAFSKNLTLNYLPAYTPQLNPVELCFNIIRTYVNKKNPRTFSELENSLKIAISHLDSSICKKIISKVWFKK